MIKLIKINLRLFLCRKSLLYTLLVTLLISLLALTSAYSYSDNMQHGIASNLVRLPVIANSDSGKGQAIKRKIRDNVLDYMKSQTVNLKSTNEARDLIINNLGIFEKIAQDTLKANGFNYEAKAYFGKFPFPTKVYGDVTLPPGEYQALRIVLGKGSGANWWCVMFPPLCFVDASKGIVPDSSKSQLKSSMTTEEYNVIMSNSSSSESEIKIKFKIVELFQQSKMKLASLKRQ